MTAPLLPADEFLAFGSRIEKQSLRALKRFQEYGRWAEGDTGLDGVLELAAKILLDAQIYELEERTLAFEMLACEALACRSDMPDSPASGLVVVLGGRGDKLSLYRQLLRIIETLGMSMSRTVNHHHAVGLCQARGQGPAKLAGIGRCTMDHHHHGPSIALTKDMHLGVIDFNQVTGRWMGFIDPSGI